MKLLIASNNAHKVQEIEAILKDYFEEMVTMKEAGLSIDVVEDGDTFEKNAVKKAVEVLEKAGLMPLWPMIPDCVWMLWTVLPGSIPPGTPAERATIPRQTTASLWRRWPMCPMKNAPAALSPAWLWPEKDAPCSAAADRWRVCACALLPEQTASAMTPTSFILPWAKALPR